MKPDWKDAPKWARWLAMDQDERWFWHETKPEKSIWSWQSSGEVATAGEVPAWDESLERRP